MRCPNCLNGKHRECAGRCDECWHHDLAIAVQAAEKILAGYRYLYLDPTYAPNVNKVHRRRVPLYR